ncbi:MAG: hypothetical protein ACHQRM_10160 [Bacteroidia bacterium]
MKTDLIPELNLSVPFHSIQVMGFRTGFAYLVLLLLCPSLYGQVHDSSFVPSKAASHAGEDTSGLRLNHLILKPAFDFDQRFSFIRGASVNIWGERAGVLVNDKFKCGIGGYYMDQNLKYAIVDQNGMPLYYAHRNLYFGTCYIEPFLLRRKYWELSIPIELGFGYSIFKSYDSYTNIQLANLRKIFIPAGMGLSFSLKLPTCWGWRPPRWFGINFLAGYRYCILENEFQTDYNGLFWSISGTIFLDRFVDDLHYWKQKKKARKLLKGSNSAH